MVWLPGRAFVKGLEHETRGTHMRTYITALSIILVFPFHRIENQEHVIRKPVGKVDVPLLSLLSTFSFFFAIRGSPLLSFLFLFLFFYL